MMAHTFRRSVPVWIAGHVTRLDEAVLTQKMAEAMDQTKVTAWSEQSGFLICRDCAQDAMKGGARLTQTRVLKGRVCAWCGQEIGNDRGVGDEE